MIKNLFSSKKVKMSDIASPTPSKAALKAIDYAMKRAQQDQSVISHKAATLRSGS